MYKYLHRNSQKRFYFENTSYFLTIKTKDNFPFFKEKIFCEVFMENLKICKELKKFLLFVFNLLYDHTHLLILPDKYNFSQIAQALKKNVTQDINKIMGIYPGGANSNSRLLKVDVEYYRKKYGFFQTEFPPFQWQKSFYDQYIRKQRDFDTHYNYTINNHIKHGLSKDWKYNNFGYENLIDK